ncbi:hypothetical protein BDF14DRAFT_1416138 [Spinellus fusiger]|nr:hypothetical protein BDF14DRAFT_1416138 [Spinellus fusiger]
MHFLQCHVQASKMALLHRGWVHYYSPLRFRSSWRKRYLVLTSSELKLYKSEKTGCFSGENTFISFSMSQCGDIKRHDCCKHSPNAFVIELKNKKRTKLTFYCNSEEENDIWIETIHYQMFIYSSYSQSYETKVETPSTLDKWISKLHSGTLRLSSSTSSSIFSSSFFSSPLPTHQEQETGVRYEHQASTLPRSTSLSAHINTSIGKSQRMPLFGNTMPTQSHCTRRKAKDLWKPTLSTIIKKEPTSIIEVSTWDMPLPPRRYQTSSKSYFLNSHHLNNVPTVLSSPTFGYSSPLL